MDKSFHVYVDIFETNNTDDSSNSQNSLERKLNTYDVVKASDITDNSCGGDEELISFSELSCDKPGSKGTSPQATTEELEPGDADSNKAKLCGFLKVHKPGDKIHRRRRWFVFSEEMCRLLYFRTPKDMIPRCDIDIASASFFLQAPSNDNTMLNKFEIRTRDSVFILEAADQRTMLYWLQELQNYREKFIATRQRNFPLRLNMMQGVDEGDSAEGSPMYDLKESSLLVDNVSLPKDTVGSQTKDDFLTGGGGGASGNFPLTNLRDELRKMVSGLWQQRNWKRQQSENTVIAEESESPPKSHFNLKRTIKSKSADMKQKILRHKSGSDNTEETSMNTCPSIESICNRCSAYEEQIGMTKEELTSLEEELQATRELTWILQKQIDEFVREKAIQNSLSESNCIADTQTEMLQEQERKIINLEHLLAATQEEKEILKSTNGSLEGEIEGLEDQISAFRDSLQAKDHVVINLTEQLLSVEQKLENKEILHNIPSYSSPHGKQINPQGSSTPQSNCSPIVQENRELQRLKDMVNGYKMQNQFLNKEIMELNKLRQEDTTRLQELVQTCVKLETCYYDEHRKYVACLKELGKNQNDDDPGSLQILENLLEDALVSRRQWSGVRKSKNYGDANKVIMDSDEPKYDENGFPLVDDDSLVDNSFDDKIATIEKQTDALYAKAKSIEEGLSTTLQWEKYMANIGVGTTAQRNKELKYLIRGGIPNAYRSTVWKWCVDFATDGLKSGYNENYYESLIKCLKDSHLLMSATAKQVELDLLRTLPGNKFYETVMSDKVQELRRILLAFSLHDPVVGYCQGLNRITAIALLFLKEEDAFWCLVAIVNRLLPHNYFCAGMQGSHTDQRVLYDIVQEKLPTICSHLKELQVDMCVFTFNWFLTIYIDSIPPQMYLRIWDSFLYEGSKVLFRYAVAFLKHGENDIMSINESSQMHLFLRSLGQKMTDVNRVAKVAFHGINPFPMKHIVSRRQHHLAIVKAELDKMEEQRQSYRKKRPQTEDLMSFDDPTDNFVI